MEQTIRKTRQLVIDQMLKDVVIPDDSHILEPSAGEGDLALGIKGKFPSAKVDCIELNLERFNTLALNMIRRY